MRIIICGREIRSTFLHTYINYYHLIAVLCAFTPCIYFIEFRLHNCISVLLASQSYVRVQLKISSDISLLHES
jgi:hypothetical protein